MRLQGFLGAAALLTSALASPVDRSVRTERLRQPQLQTPVNIPHNVSSSSSSGVTDYSVGKGHGKDKGKVDVSLYVMSRCPDARNCESVFEEVFKTEGMYDKVNLEMTYIGRTDTSTPLGITCPHGPLECLANIHQLCFAAHLPLDQWYPAIQCMNRHPNEVGSLELARSCVAERGGGVDWDKSGIKKCVEGGHRGERRRGGIGKEGKRLLRGSAAKSSDDGVGKSCTIRIGSGAADEAGKRRRDCVVDGGVWTGCEEGHTPADFVRIIEKEWESLHRKA